MPLFGTQDRHVRRIRDSLGVSVTARNGAIHVAGDENAVRTATEVLEQLQQRLQQRGALFPDDVTDVLNHISESNSATLQSSAHHYSSQHTAHPPTHARTTPVCGCYSQS